MNANTWFLTALILFIVAGVLFFVAPDGPTTAYRFAYRLPSVFICAGLACLASGFLAVTP